MFAKFLRSVALALTFAAPLAQPALAQSAYDPAILVNDAAITYYELDQRQRLLTAFRTAGDVAAQARRELIDDRLKQQELDRVGLQLTPGALDQALEDFAARANMTLPQFQSALAQQGIDPETLRDYVRIGVAWRDYIRARFGGQVVVTDADVARAQTDASAGGSAVEVLLSEIIIPAPPERAAEARRIAQQIAGLRSFSAFEDAARRYSALPSRDNGGRIDWLPVANYPGPLQSVLLGLRPGEVTDPIEIPNGIALFQLRAVREGAVRRPTDTALDYATLTIPGAEARQAAANVAARTDTCDDLYTSAGYAPQSQLTRQTRAPGQIASDVALELARLDANEISTRLTDAEGRLVMVMLCERRTTATAGGDPEDLRGRLRSQRLAALAEGLIADLRNAAVIRGR